MYFLKILFISRERGKEGEREGEKHQRVSHTTCLSHTHNWGLGSQLRHVP